VGGLGWVEWLMYSRVIFGIGGLLERVRDTYRYYTPSGLHLHCFLCMSTGRWEDGVGEGVVRHLVVCRDLLAHFLCSFRALLVFEQDMGISESSKVSYRCTVGQTPQTRPHMDPPRPRL